MRGFPVAALMGMVVACADAPVGPAASAADPQYPPATESDPLPPPRVITLSLMGRGITNEAHVIDRTGDRWHVSTTLEAATPALVVGQPVDTLLAIAFSGVPAMGAVTLPPPTTVTIKEVSPGIPLIFYEDSPGRLELLIFSRVSGFPVRQFVQARAATLTVTDYVAPSPLGSNGVVKGRVDFMADEYFREWAPDGAITIRKAAGQSRIMGEFQVQLEHRMSEIDVTSMP